MINKENSLLFSKSKTELRNILLILLVAIKLIFSKASMPSDLTISLKSQDKLIKYYSKDNLSDEQ